MKLKVCGMKYIENMQQIAALHPDYLGFIFYDKSKRNFEGTIPDLPEGIQKTGVFVNASIEEVIGKIQQYQLQAVQLHGDESVAYIEQLQIAKQDVEIIKVFGVKDEFDFSVLQPYEKLVDYFLFDTKGKERGGNGITFNWELLKGYSFQTPFFLSGGIGEEHVAAIKNLIATGLPIYAVDINSKFEITAGMKSVEKVKEFKKHLVG